MNKLLRKTKRLLSWLKARKPMILKHGNFRIIFHGDYAFFPTGRPAPMSFTIEKGKVYFGDMEGGEK